MTLDGKRLDTKELAARWGMTVGALEAWRAQKIGPKFIKLGRARGSKVIYLLTEVESYEQKHTVKTREA